MSDQETITALLARHQQGDPQALGELVPLVYAQLRGMAGAIMKNAGPGQTLQPTALVHEAFLKMSAGENFSAQGKAHFLALAARVMRQILVDHARSRASAKRGGGQAGAPLDEAAAYSPAQAPSLLALDLALNTLASLDTRKARVVEMRYFGGLTGDEIACVLGVSTATVTRDLRMAEAWLARELGNSHAAAAL